MGVENVAEKQPGITRLYVGFIAVLIIFGLVGLQTSVAYSITKRNDDYVPSQFVPVNNTVLVDYLEELRKLNDTVVNNYIDQIEDVLSSGDYEEATRLISELQDYLDTLYGNGTGDKDLDTAISFIKSINSVGENETYIDLAEFVSLASNLTGDLKLLDIARKLSSGEGLSSEDINYLSKVLKNTSINRSMGNLNLPFKELRELLHRSSGGGNPPPIIGSAPSMASPPPTAVIAVEYLQYLFPLVVLGILLWYHRDRLSQYASTIKRRISAEISHIQVIRRRRMDPVARLYYEWLVVARAWGYKREKWMTPREFLRIVKDQVLAGVGWEVTRIYEEKYYGDKTPSGSRISEIEEKLRGVRA